MYFWCAKSLSQYVRLKALYKKQSYWHPVVDKGDETGCLCTVREGNAFVGTLVPVYRPRRSRLMLEHESVYSLWRSRLMLELLLTVHEGQGWCWNMGVCLQSVKIKTNVGIWVSVYNPWRSRLILEHGCLLTVHEGQGCCWNTHDGSLFRVMSLLSPPFYFRCQYLLACF